MIEQYLKPVSKKLRCKKLTEQLDKVYLEYKEAQVEILKVRSAELKHCSSDVINVSKHKAAVEVGDIIIASVTLLDMLGYNKEELFKEVYEKNNVRHYYDN